MNKLRPMNAADPGESQIASRRLTALAACAGLALTVGAAQAQRVTATSTAASESGTGALEEIVVTAEYRTERLQQTPLAITALTANALADRNITSLVDVSNAAPNVTMFEANAAYGKTNAAFIRGIGQGDFNFASAEPGVGIYIDDVYFSTTFGSMFDLLDLSQVEVLRGPQGTLFGKNSIGGAIRMISKKPQGDDTGYIEVTGGNFSRREVRGAFDVALIKDVLMLRVSGMSKQRDGYVDRIDYACAHPATAGTLPEQQLGQGNCVVGKEGGVDVKGARAQLRWVPSDGFEDNFTADVYDDNSQAAAEVMLVANPALAPALAGFNASTLIPKYGIPYDSRFVTAGTYTTYSSFFDPNTGTAYPAVNTVHSWGVSNVADWAIVDTVHLKSITSEREYWGDFSDDQDNSPMGVAWAYNLLDHRQFTQEFQLTGKAFDNKLDWATGLFYFDGYSLNRGHINLNFLAGFFPPGPPFFGQPIFNFNQDDPAKTEDKAVFAQTTYAFTDQLHLTTGVRFTKEDKNYTFNHYNPLLAIPNPVLDLRDVEARTSYSHVDWKVGLDYQWTPDIMTYVSATTGFRGGGFNPRPFTNLQLTSFKPEKNTSFEIGGKSEFLDHKVRANAALYFSQYRQVVITSQTVDATGAPFTAPQNVGSADIKGLELELEANPVAALQISATAGLTDFKWKSLGNSEGCQDLGASAAPGVNCIAGNPGYSDISPGISKWKGNVGAQYAIPVAADSTLTPRFDFSAQTKRFNNNWNNYAPAGGPVAVTPGLGLLSGRLTWENKVHGWSVAAFGTNLTNRYFYQSFLDLRAFGEGQMSAQPAEPREWGITFRKNFL
jgi:iron complex outermembrane receptor protein